MKNSLLSAVLCMVLCISITWAQTGNNDFPGGISAPIDQNLTTEGRTMLNAVKSEDGSFVTSLFTFRDIILFSYFESSEFNIYDSENNLLETLTLNADEYFNYITSEGVYRVTCNNTFTLLVGDAITNYVNGYFAVNEAGRGLATKLNTWMMQSFSSGHDDFIVFAYEDNTDVTVRNLETNEFIYGTSLNDGEYLSFNDLNAIPYTTPLQILSNKMVSALSYTDQDYYVPSANGTFAGDLFYGYSAYAGGWANSITVTSYYDNNEVLITDLDTGEEIASFTLMEGQVGSVNIYSRTFWKVEATQSVTAANIPYLTWSGSYQYMTKSIDKSGTGAGTLFYLPTVGSRVDVFSFANENNITITRLGRYDEYPYTDNEVIWEGTLAEGEGYHFTSSYGSFVYKIEGSENVSVLQSNAGFGADFVALEYSFDLPDLSVSASDIEFSVPDTEYQPGDLIQITFTVHNYGLVNVPEVLCNVYDNDPDGGNLLPPFTTEVLTDIAPSENKSFTIDYRIPDNPEYRSIYLKINPDNEIQESNYSNNKGQKPLRPNNDLQPPLAVNTSAPLYLTFEDDILSPNPFDVRFDYFNNGQQTLTNVTARLDLLGGLSVMETKSQTYEMGDIAPNATGSVELQIEANPDSLGYNYYSMTFLQGEEEIKTIQKMVIVGEVPARINDPGFILRDVNAYPNPFSDHVNIRYSLQTSQHVRVRVFDITGSLVATLADSWQQPGAHQFRFEPGNSAHGIYLVLFEADGQSGMIRVIASGQQK